MPTLPDEIRPLLDAAYPLIKIGARVKIPAEPGWRTATYTPAELLSWIESGNNLGWRLTENDLVLDVDPRNFQNGVDSLAQLIADYALDLSVCPHVLTGSGGHHYYFTKPTDVVIVETLPAYPGLEFKSSGRQVLIPGSLHPAGPNYLWAPGAPVLRPRFPDYLLQAITRPAMTGGAVGGHTNEQIQACLDQLPVEAYRQQDDWLNLMMSCHAGSNGDARQEFLSWSAGDPVYGNRISENGMRWDSLHYNRPGGITIRTLLHEVRQHGGTIPWESADADFEELNDADGEGEHPLVVAIRILNNTYAFVTTNNCRVYSRQYNNSAARFVYSKLTVHDFKSKEDNITVAVNDKRIGRGTWWLTQPARRSYEGIDFAPPPIQPQAGSLDLWEGTYLKPKYNPTITRFLDFVLEVICDYDIEVYAYVSKWMAFLVQQPGQMAEVALILQGDKGTGKGTFGVALMHLYRQHSMQIAHPSRLTGNFNAHLEGLVYLFMDEGFWAGDHKAEGVLKNLITESNIAYEAKGQDVRIGRNCLSVCMASNSDWVIPASLDGERRYCMLQISDKHMGDFEYFGKIKHELEHGGYESLFAELMALDIGTWHPRDNVPQTAALQLQKYEGLTDIQAWWFERLQLGTLPQQRTDWAAGETEVPSPALQHSFLESLNGRRTLTFRSAQTALGIQLKKLVPQYRSHQIPALEHEGGERTSDGRIRVSVISSLADCRKRFEKQFGQVNWSEFTY